MTTFTDKLKHAWNAFRDEDTSDNLRTSSMGASFSSRPERFRLNTYGDRSIVGSIYTRIGIDMASIAIQHVKLDQNGRMIENVVSDLDNCLNLDPNLDQTASTFKQDIAMTLFEKGVAAIVPVETTLNPSKTGGYDIRQLRVGEVLEWYPQHVKVSVYNERVGRREDLILAKKFVAIVENPFYSVMNEPNSTLQRLIRKLSLLDAVDEQASSAKLDLIIQLPYVIKSEARREQAEMRRKSIEEQLRGSQYGIAYTDGTERITQLNRPAENNLWKQIQDLTEMLYAHLGLTPEVMNGTASEEVMLNYHQRTIKPLMTAITEAMTRTFLTKTARTQGQSLVFFRDPFQLIPVSSLAEIGDKFVRNEILTPNELRAILGMRPHEDPKADDLRNPNMPIQDQLPVAPAEEVGYDPAATEYTE